MTGIVAAFLTMKGGVGKTTLAANVTRSIADLYQKKILLIDGDSQCNLSQLFYSDDALDSGDERNFNSAFGSHKQYSPHDLRVNVYKNQENGSTIDFIRGSYETFRLNATATPAERSRAEEAFAAFMEEARNDYDLVIVDTNPSATFTTLQVLGAADFLISPITHDVFSVRGIEQVVKEMSRVHSWLENPNRVLLIKNKIEQPTTDQQAKQYQDRDNVIRGRFPLLGPSLAPLHIRSSLIIGNMSRQHGFVADQRNVRADHLARLVTDFDNVAKFFINKTQTVPHAPRNHRNTESARQATWWGKFTGSVGGRA